MPRLDWMSATRRTLMSLLGPAKTVALVEGHWAYRLGLARGRKTGRSEPSASDLRHLHSQDAGDRKMYAAGMLAATRARSSSASRKGR